jgi:hypothetical protein
MLENMFRAGLGAGCRGGADANSSCGCCLFGEVLVDGYYSLLEESYSVVTYYSAATAADTYYVFSC